MTLEEFHGMIHETMNLQASLAKADEREEDSPGNWYEEFIGILEDSVEEAKEAEDEDDDVE